MLVTWHRALVGSLGSLCLAGCLSVPPAAGSRPTEAATEEAPQLLWTARNPISLYREGEIRKFEMRQGGELLGYSWGRYAGEDPQRPGLHRFETRIELHLPGHGPVRSEGLVVLDDRGHLVEGFERSIAAELRFTREGDDLVITDGKDEERFGYAPTERDVAVMTHGAILHEEMMLAARDLPRGAVETRLIPLSGGRPVAWRAQVQPDGEGLVLHTSLGEQIRFRDGRIQSIRADSSDLEIVAMDEATWPQWSIEGPRAIAYAPPPDAAFTIREVELPGKTGEPALFGEVLVPTEGEGPFPGVVYLSSSGREDRHGFAGPPPVDLGSHAITDALAQAGFVVLRFDERGQGKSERGEVGFWAQVEDARRAFRTLVVQDEVDPDRVVMVGHGEGGLRALHVAAAQPDAVVGVALLAVPGRPYREVFFSQAERSLANVAPEVRKKALAEQRKMLADVEKGENVPPELEPQAQWIREALDQDPRLLIPKLRARLFLAQPGKDFEVDPEVDLEALVTAARDAKRPYQVARYPELDHLFKPEPGESSPARYLEPGREVDPGFLADLVKWARETTAPPRKRR